MGVPGGIGHHAANVERLPTQRFQGRVNEQSSNIRGAMAKQQKYRAVTKQPSNTGRTIIQPTAPPAKQHSFLSNQTQTHPQANHPLFNYYFLHPGPAARGPRGWHPRF